MSKPITTYEDYVKSVKRINRRIVETNRVLGQKSHAYNEFASRIEFGFKESEINTHRHGFAQISRSRNIYERLKKSGELGIMESLEDVQTMRERRKKVKEYVPNTKLTVEEQNEVLQDMDGFLGSMDESLRYLYDVKEEDAMQAVSIMKQKKKKSYDELFMVQKIAKKYANTKGDIFDGL